jgi:hypothetical protein
MLLKRLQDQALGNVEMSTNSLKAATYLMSQAIGNPSQSHELSGPNGSAIPVEATVKFVSTAS